MIAATGDDHNVRIFDASNGVELKKFTDFKENILDLKEIDKNQLALFSKDQKSMVIWDWNEQSNFHKLCGHNGFINSIARAPIKTIKTDSGPNKKDLSKETKLVSVGDDGFLRLWKNYETEEKKWHFDKKMNVVAWSYDGECIASGGDEGKIYLLKLNSNDKPMPLDGKVHSGSIKALCWDPKNHKCLISGCSTGEMIIWEAATSKIINPGTDRNLEINCLAWNKTGINVFACWGSKVSIFENFRKGTEEKYIETGSSVFYACWNNDDASIFVGGSSFLRQYNLNGGIMMTFLDNCEENFRYLALSDDGQILFTSSGECDNYEAWIWDPSKGTKTKNLRFEAPIKSGFWISDNKNMIVSSQDSIKLIHILEDEIKKFDVNDKIKCLAIDSEGKYLAVATEDKKLEIWETSTFKRSTVELPEIGYSISCLCWGEKLNLFTGGTDDHLIKQWELKLTEKSFDLNEIKTLREVHTEAISCLDFSRDNNLLASGGEDKKVMIFNLEGEEKVLFYEHKKAILCLAWSNYDKFLLSGSADGEIKLVKTNTDGSFYLENRSVFYHDGPIYGISWKPQKPLNKNKSEEQKQEMKFASCDNDCLKIWDCDKDLEIKSIILNEKNAKEDEEEDENVSQSPRNTKSPKATKDKKIKKTNKFINIIWANDHVLYTVGEDMCLRLWDVKCGVPMKKKCFGIDGSINEQSIMKIGLSRDGKIVLACQKELSFFADFNLWIMDEDFEMFELFYKMHNFDNLEKLQEEQKPNGEAMGKLINYRFGGFTTIFHLLWQSKNFLFLEMVMSFCRQQKIYPNCFPLDWEGESVFSYINNAINEQNNNETINAQNNNERQESKKKLFESVDSFIKFVIKANVGLGCLSMKKGMLSKIYNSSHNLLIDFLNSRFKEVLAPFKEVVWKENKVNFITETFFSENIFQEKNLELYTKPACKKWQEGIDIEQKNLKNAIPCHVRVCDIPLDFFDFEFFQQLSDSTNFDDIFGQCFVILMVLDLSWKKYGKKTFLANFVIYFGFLALLMVNSLWIFPGIIETDATDYDFFMASLLVNIFILIFIAYLAKREYGEMKDENYFCSFWNYCDLVLISLNLVSCILDFLVLSGVFDDFSSLRVIHSLSFFFSFFRIFDLFRGHREACFLIENVKDIVNGMGIFLVLLMIFMLNCCFSVYILQTDYSIGIVSCMIYFYKVLLTDFDIFDEINSPAQWMVQIFFLTSTFVLVIVMMNVLIAIILNAYQSLDNKKDIIYENNRMKIINEFDRHSSEDRSIKLGGGNYLITLFRTEPRMREPLTEENDKNALVNQQKGSSVMNLVDKGSTVVNSKKDPLGGKDNMAYNISSLYKSKEYNDEFEKLEKKARELERHETEVFNNNKEINNNNEENNIKQLEQINEVVTKAINELKEENEKIKKMIQKNDENNKENLATFILGKVEKLLDEKFGKFEKLLDEKLKKEEEKVESPTLPQQTKEIKTLKHSSKNSIFKIIEKLSD